MIVLLQTYGANLTVQDRLSAHRIHDITDNTWMKEEISQSRKRWGKIFNHNSFVAVVAKTDAWDVIYIGKIGTHILYYVFGLNLRGAVFKIEIRRYSRNKIPSWKRFGLHQLLNFTNEMLRKQCFSIWRCVWCHVPAKINW